MACCQGAILVQAEMVVVCSQQGLSCESIGTVTPGQEPVVGGFLAGPYSIQIPHPCCQGTKIYETILLDHPQQSTVLTTCGLTGSLRWFAWHQSSSVSMPPGDAVDGSTCQTHATSNSTVPHALTGKCKHFMPNIYRGWMRHLSTITEKYENFTIVDTNLPQCEGIFEQINWANIHPFGNVKTGQGKVGFRWGAVTDSFNVCFNPLET